MKIRFQRTILSESFHRHRHQTPYFSAAMLITTSGDVKNSISDSYNIQSVFEIRSKGKFTGKMRGKIWERNFTNCSRFGEFSCNYEKVQCWKIGQGNIDFSCDKMWSWCCIVHIIWEQQEESLYQSRFLAVIVFKPHVFLFQQFKPQETCKLIVSRVISKILKFHSITADFEENKENLIHLLKFRQF